MAAKYGHLAVLMLLVEQNGLPPLAADNKKRTSLHFACGSGHFHVVQFLVGQCKADVSCLDVDQLSPLIYASRNGHVKIMEFCLAQPGVVSTYVDPDLGASLLHWTCLFSAHLSYQYQMDAISYVVRLKTFKAKGVNCRAKDGATPLFWLCAGGGRIEMIKLLINMGADLRVK